MKSEYESSGTSLIRLDLSRKVLVESSSLTFSNGFGLKTSLGLLHFKKETEELRMIENKLPY